MRAARLLARLGSPRRPRRVPGRRRPAPSRAAAGRFRPPHRFAAQARRGRARHRAAPRTDAVRRRPRSACNRPTSAAAPGCSPTTRRNSAPPWPELLDRLAGGGRRPRRPVRPHQPGPRPVRDPGHRRRIAESGPSTSFSRSSSRNRSARTRKDRPKKDTLPRAGNRSTSATTCTWPGPGRPCSSPTRWKPSTRGLDLYINGRHESLTEVAGPTDAGEAAAAESARVALGQPQAGPGIAGRQAVLQAAEVRSGSTALRRRAARRDRPVAVSGDGRLPPAGRHLDDDVPHAPRPGRHAGRAGTAHRPGRASRAACRRWPRPTPYSPPASTSTSASSGRTATTLLAERAPQEASTRRRKTSAAFSPGESSANC